MRRGTAFSNSAQRSSLIGIPSANLLLFVAALLCVGAIFLAAQAPPWVCLSSLTITCSLWLMQRAVGFFNLRQMTIPGFVYLVYLIIVLIPSFFVFDEQHGPFRATFMVAVESALITIPIGVLLAKGLFGFGNNETRAYFNSPVEEGALEPGPEAFAVVLAVVWGLTIIYLREVRTVPLFYMIGHPGQYRVLPELREESLKLLDSPLRYIYELMRSTFYPFLIVFSFGKYLLTRSTAWVYLFLASFLSGILYCGLSIAKSPVAFIFVILGAFYYLYRGGRVGRKFLVLLLVFFSAFPIFVVMQEYGRAVDLATTLQTLGRRVFSVPSEILYYYFEVFPRVAPFQHGNTIDKLTILTGGRFFDPGNFVGRYMWPRTLSSVTANAPFLGNLYADFGMPGVFLGGGLAGFLMQCAQIYVVRSGKSALNMSFYAFFLFSFANLNITALPIVLLSLGTLVVPVVAGTMALLHFIIVKAMRTEKPYWTRGAPLRYGAGQHQS